MAVSAPRAAPLVAVLARGIEGRMTMSDNPSARLKLGDGWTPELRSICQNECAEEMGEPACFELVGETRTGDTPSTIEPCERCLALLAARTGGA